MLISHVPDTARATDEKENESDDTDEEEYEEKNFGRDLVYNWLLHRTTKFNVAVSVAEQSTRFVYGTSESVTSSEFDRNILSNSRNNHSW